MDFALQGFRALATFFKYEKVDFMAPIDPSRVNRDSALFIAQEESSKREPQDTEVSCPKVQEYSDYLSQENTQIKPSFFNQKQVARFSNCAEEYRKKFIGNSEKYLKNFPHDNPFSLLMKKEAEIAGPDKIKSAYEFAVAVQNKSVAKTLKLVTLLNYQGTDPVLINKREKAFQFLNDIENNPRSEVEHIDDLHQSLKELNVLIDEWVPDDISSRIQIDAIEKGLVDGKSLWADIVKSDLDNPKSMGRGTNDVAVLSFIYDSIGKEKVKYVYQEETLFSLHLPEKKELDCDSTSFLVKGIADNFNISVSLAQLPVHVYLKYQDLNFEAMGGADGFLTYNIFNQGLRDFSYSELDPKVYTQKVYDSPRNELFSSLVEDNLSYHYFRESHLSEIDQANFHLVQKDEVKAHLSNELLYKVYQSHYSDASLSFDEFNHHIDHYKVLLEQAYLEGKQGDDREGDAAQFWQNFNQRVSEIYQSHAYIYDNLYYQGRVKTLSQEEHHLISQGLKHLQQAIALDSKNEQAVFNLAVYQKSMSHLLLAEVCQKPGHGDLLLDQLVSLKSDENFQSALRESNSLMRSSAVHFRKAHELTGRDKALLELNKLLLANIREGSHFKSDDIEYALSANLDQKVESLNAKKRNILLDLLYLRLKHPDKIDTRNRTLLKRVVDRVKEDLNIDDKTDKKIKYIEALLNA